MRVAALLLLAFGCCVIAPSALYAQQYDPQLMRQVVDQIRFQEGMKEVNKRANEAREHFDESHKILIFIYM